MRIVQTRRYERNRSGPPNTSAAMNENRRLAAPKQKKLQQHIHVHCRRHNLAFGGSMNIMEAKPKMTVGIFRTRFWKRVTGWSKLTIRSGV